MPKREFLQLAHVFKPEKHSPTNWFLSEKLDGHRFFWDGGLTTGVPAREVPWANTEKDDRLLAQPIATGLWSRYGKVIHAPKWWIAKLPTFPLDGELWMGRGQHQRLGSCIKKLSPTPEWSDVKAMCFISPPIDVVLGVGEINNTNFKKKFGDAPMDFVRKRGFKESRRLQFAEAYEWLCKNLPANDIVNLVTQERVEPPGHAYVERRLNEILELGGEGVMLQHPSAFWVPERSHMLLKVKPFQDDEATVVGYHWGRETDKESKLLGMMGNLIVSYQGKLFELSGFTDAERELVPGPGAQKDEGYKNPGKRVSDRWRSYEFPIGSKVTFRYRELTNDGIPKEARYWRKREE